MDDPEQILDVERLLVVASGSIAVLYLPTVMTHLRSTLAAVEIRLVMTPTAGGMIDPGAMSGVVGSYVFTSWVEAARIERLPHIALADWADVLLVMPASANTMVKVAHGIADNLALTVVLAATCPKLVVPSMNVRMWNQPAIQRARDMLEADGIGVIEPSPGIEASSGAIGVGALPTLRELCVRIAIQMEAHR